MRTRTVCFACEQAIDHHCLCLSDAMSSGLGLDVVVWIPVTVKDDHSVRCGDDNGQSVKCDRRAQRNVEVEIEQQASESKIVTRCQI